MMKRYTPREVRVFNWSPELAYAVGLLATDGCLSSDRRHVIFTSQDMEMIEHVQRILRSKCSVGISRSKLSQAYRIQIGNVQLYDWLLQIGLTPNKSLTISRLAIPDEYFADFVRGNLDGDGSILSYTDTYNTFRNAKYIYRRLWIRFCSGSENYMEWIQKQIADLFDIHGRVHKTKPNHLGHRMTVLKFAKKESLRLLNKMYYAPDIPFLKRKWTIANEFIKKM